MNSSMEVRRYPIKNPLRLPSCLSVIVDMKYSHEDSSSIDMDPSIHPSPREMITPRRAQEDERAAELAMRDSLIETLMARMQEYEDDREQLEEEMDKLRAENEKLKQSTVQLNMIIMQLQARDDTPRGGEEEEEEKEVTTTKGRSSSLSSSCELPFDLEDNAFKGRRQLAFSLSSVMGDVIHGFIGFFVYAFLNLIMYVWKQWYSSSGNKQDHMYLVICSSFVGLYYLLKITYNILRCVQLE